MSLVIDTSEFVSESESEVREPQSEVQVVDESEEEAIAEASQPPTVASEPAEDQEEDLDDFKSQIWNAEMRCKGKEAIVEDLKDQLKFAKADYEDSVADLRKLATSGGKPTKKANPQVQDQIQGDAGSTIANDDWKSRSFIEMLKASEIAGLGEKKFEALAEVCQTFGDFEALRTRASLEGVHLKEVLPAGFGEKITDQMEEAYFASGPICDLLQATPEPKPKQEEAGLPQVGQVLEDDEETPSFAQVNDHWEDVDDEPMELEPKPMELPTETTSNLISLDDL
jgi:hypothetical protein